MEALGHCSTFGMASAHYAQLLVVADYQTSSDEYPQRASGVVGSGRRWSEFQSPGPANPSAPSEVASGQPSSLQPPVSRPPGGNPPPIAQSQIPRFHAPSHTVPTTPRDIDTVVPPHLRNAKQVPPQTHPAQDRRSAFESTRGEKPPTIPHTDWQREVYHTQFPTPEHLQNSVSPPREPYAVGRLSTVPTCTGSTSKQDSDGAGSSGAPQE